MAAAGAKRDQEIGNRAACQKRDSFVVISDGELRKDTMKQFCLAVFFWLSSLEFATSQVFITESPGAADVWIIITDRPDAADCWLHVSDIVDRPNLAEFWAIITDSPAAADKWIILTENRGSADSVFCLLEE